MVVVVTVTEVIPTWGGCSATELIINRFVQLYSQYTVQVHWLDCSLIVCYVFYYVRYVLPGTNTSTRLLAAHCHNQLLITRRCSTMFLIFLV